MGARGIPAGGGPPSRAEERLLGKLARRRTRGREGLFLAEGKRVVGDLLDAGIVPRLAVVSSTFGDTRDEERLLDALAGLCPVRVVPDNVVAGLADTRTPQGVLVAAEEPEHSLEAVQLGDPAVVLVLDGVQDPGNVGTLIRSAEALGASAVVALPGTVDPWNPKVVRAAAGSLFRLPVVRSALADLLEFLDRTGCALYAADAEGTPPDTAALPQRIALAVGNEGGGLSPEVRASAEGVLAVPLRGPAESLNVAAAAAILLYLLTARAPLPG